MLLTDTAIRSAKPGEKPCKLRDSGNPWLLVTPTGGNFWRMEFLFGGIFGGIFMKRDFQMAQP
jgi:hypothetical protein